MLADLLQEMSYPELAEMIGSLRRLLRNHEKWMTKMNRTVICGTEIDKAYLDPRVHRQCDFGTWYMGVESPAILNDREFVDLGIAHRRLHEGMHGLVEQYQERQAISERLYDGVAAASASFNDLALRFLQNLESVQQQYDPLTKLLSRKAMHFVLEGELSRISRVDRSSCIAIAEVEQIRALHAAHAFEQADKVLVNLSAMLIETLRHYDTVARYGESQFLFCFPETGVAETSAILERINANLERPAFIAQNHDFGISFLCAIAELDPTLSVQQSIANIDKALEESREYGGSAMITHINLHHPMS